MERTNFLIKNGGGPLEGCPKNWDDAKEIELNLNNLSGNSDIKWEFDCGFKLDYDGPILSVSSRFYPPKEFYGPTWDGTVSIYILNKMIESKKFDCNTLHELRKQVDEYIYGFIDKIKKCFNN